MEVIPVPTLSLPVTCGGGEGFGCIFPEKSRIQSHPLPADPTDEATRKRVQVRDHGREEKRKNGRKTEMCRGGVSAMCQVQCKPHFIHAGRSTLIFLIIAAQRR